MRGTDIINILPSLLSLRPVNAAIVDVSKRIAYFNLVSRCLLSQQRFVTYHECFWAAGEITVILPFMVMTESPEFFFQFFDKGCHTLCLNVICEQRHVSKLPILKFHGKYIWRLLGLTESDAPRTQTAALKKNGIEYRSVVLLRGSNYFQPNIHMKVFQAVVFKVIAFSVTERRREEKFKDMSLKFKLYDCRRAHNDLASILFHLVSKLVFLKAKSCNWSIKIIQDYKKQCNSL